MMKHLHESLNLATLPLRVPGSAIGHAIACLPGWLPVFIFMHANKRYVCFMGNCCRMLQEKAYQLMVVIRVSGDQSIDQTQCPK